MRYVFFILMFLSSFVLGNSYSDMQQWESEAYKKFVENQLVQNMDSFKSKTLDCFNQGVSSKISQPSINVLKNLNLTEEEITSVLVYFHYKAHLNCMGELPIIVVGYLNEARALNIGKYSIKNDPDYKQLNYLIVDTQSIVRGEYKFSRLSKDVQDKLNSLDELKKPFSLDVVLQVTNN